MSRVLHAAVLTVAIGFGNGVANASPTPSQGDQARSLPQATALGDGELTLAPLAFIQFCNAHADQCRPAGESEVALTPARWSEMAAVNAAVNARIAPNAGKDGFKWSLETRYGNCNDYAVQKRSALIARGFPANALSLAAVVTGSGENHLVLTVRTDRGDFVLDNLRGRVVAWNLSGYKWVKRQSAAQPRYWVSLEPSRAARPTIARTAPPVRRGAEKPVASASAASDPFSNESWTLRGGVDG
ncbi:hypothetical protein GCM10007036_15840 [Alsobacter metallidurans]|uniref:Transglutaminase-like cysteine proteinase n=1 Tax=Alsobacter metallidurans TaxID=340221 RepID=A0A917I5W8_9HYPH|nr:transglutaminase-like cysteine peptidase [Alsobacter metallidurans]GGH15680.1 hypothetical protein GCM10007036_15840 [Alsobacter metallidurans]